MKYILLLVGVLCSVGSIYFVYQGAYIDSWFFLLFIGGLLLIGCFFFYAHISSFLHTHQKIRLVFFWSSCLCMCFALLLESLILFSVKNEDIPHLPYVLVLGTEIENGKPSLILQKRLNKAQRYLKRNPQTMVVTTGGVEKGETLSEAEIMKNYLIQHGINEHRILTENRSKNTYENFLYTKQTYPALQKEDVLLVTSDFHLFRSKLLAKRTGVNIQATQYSNVPSYMILQNHIRECAAILKSYVFDKK